ncbi:MAG: Cof-type HAD-IIB family hydrolase [Eubacteriales bacterium]|nr:Cof-type HAD-IIB family hydrolase [Eubacteriales bacterium]
MTGKKALFFDIDGTLWHGDNIIPESTRQTIKELRKNGHLTFICTGRTRGYIQNPELLNLGFDGIVSGCGTMIEYKNEIVFCHEIDNTFMADTIQKIRSYGFRPILEGKDFLYMDDSEFSEDYYGKKLKAELGEHLRTIEGEWEKWEVCKFSCATEDADRENCFRELEPDFDFMIHNEAVVEIVPKGFHKGTGIEKVCELLDLDIADTFAFGDSANDLGMFKSAGISIAMGDGQDVAKEAADYITTPLHEDGIRNACRHFGLI